LGNNNFYDGRNTKNRPVDKKQLDIFLKKYSFLILCFNKKMKNSDIIKELGYSRENFNKVQNEIFFHIAVIEPKIKDITNMGFKTKNKRAFFKTFKLLFLYY